MKPLLILLGVTFAASSLCQADNKPHRTYKNTNEPFKFHGRLSVYCGTPSFRIWIVGTSRLLGVPGGDLEPAEMPDSLRKLFTTTSTEVYADFSVTPLDKYKKGHMQHVRIDDAENLVIYRDDKFVEKRQEL